MVKTRKTKNLRKRSRSRRGGDTMQTLASIKIKNNMIMANADKIESGECNVSEIKEFAEDEAKLINELIEQEQEKENMQAPGNLEEPESVQAPEPVQESPLESKPEPEPEPAAPAPQTVVPLMQQNIMISGYTGTVGGLLSSIRNTIGQLRKQTGQSYKDSVNKLTMVTKQLSSSTTTSTDQVKRILQENQITFKNNKLFGGKTKKRRGGKKSKRHTKRR